VKRLRISAQLRERVSRTARFSCGYCLTSQRVVGPLLEIDHILPASQGGTSKERNLWLACPLCNSYKADRVASLDPVTNVVVSLFNPREDRWSDHFEWTDGGTVIVGRTPVGRATALALNVNEPDVVAARRLWVTAGWHPPHDT
jgi:hypothetical protein